jgi:Cdc6-like AAA superfamily ATPase
MREIKVLDTIFKFNCIVENEPQHHLQFERTVTIRKKFQQYFKKAKYPALTDQQMFFFLVILGNSLECNSVENINVAATLNLKRAELIEMRFERIVNELINLGYIEIKGRGNHRHRGDTREIGVVSQIYDAVILDKQLGEKVIEVPSLYTVAFAAKNFMSDINHGNTSLGIATYKLQEHIIKVDSPAINIIKNYDLNALELIVYLICLWDRISDPNNHKVSINRILDGISERDTSTMFRIKKEFLYGTNVLFKQDLVKHANDDEFETGLVLKLSDRINDLLEEDQELCTKQKNYKELVKIEEKDVPTLFFNADVQREVDKLKTIFEPTRYKEMVAEFEKNSLPRTANLLLYGASGSGKTELAKYLSVGKMVYFVDVSQWKSMYYGRSQQLVVEQFKKFNAMAKANPFNTVMILNEADSLLNKRLDNVTSASEQTNNSITNILLENIENLQHGSLLIATTNNADSLDTAMSRRFSFKLHIDKPNTETSYNLWKHYISGYSEDLYNKLKYINICGGSITNIAKRCLIERCTNGIVEEMMIYQWATEESNFNSTTKPMGFK